jgi:DNA-binding NarL/FixJ family response regulator
MNQHRQISIAVIDDHDQFRNGICDFLEKDGFRVLVRAENGSAAVEKLSNTKALPDVCITDVNMPVMNGFETAKALHKQFPELKILGYSLNDDAAIIVEMLRSGANGYVVKGGSIEELKRAIETVHKEGVYFGETTGKILLEYLRKRGKN